MSEFIVFVGPMVMVTMFGLSMFLWDHMHWATQSFAVVVLVGTWTVWIAKVVEML